MWNVNYFSVSIIKQISQCSKLHRKKTVYSLRKSCPMGSKSRFTDIRHVPYITTACQSTPLSKVFIPTSPISIIVLFVQPELMGTKKQKMND